MVISSLNIPRILDLIRLIESYLAELRPFAFMTREAFLSDKKNPPFVESYLRRSLEAIFDIGRHILTKTYGSRGIEYKAIARELGEKAVITTELADLLVEMAGYRNRMVHFYKEVTPGEMYEIVTKHLSDFDRVIREFVFFIRTYEATKQS